MTAYDIKFIEDINVDRAFDERLKEILSLCFANQPVFKEQRFFKEMPPHRWYIEDGNKLIAHTALHEKKIFVDNHEIQIGGIAEVCVHPEYRRKGIVKQMLEIADSWMIEHKYKYAMLFGDTEVYRSSGYFNIDNEIKYVDYKTKELRIEKNIDAMVKLLSDAPWPEGLVDLNGPTF